MEPPIDRLKTSQHYQIGSTRKSPSPDHAGIGLLMPVMTTLGNRLKELRLAAGLSQEQLGIEAGLEPAPASARMNRYELGKRAPDAMTLEMLGEVLNAPAAYFHASSDDLAAVILRFHRLSKAEKLKVMRLLEET